MSSYDLIIVGGGMVGMSLAAALADSSFKVALIDKSPAPELPSGAFATRVSALNHASERFLTQIGAWQHLQPARLSAYQQMAVWEHDSFANIEFSAYECGLPHLGHIVENSHICYALYQRLLAASNISLQFDTAPAKLTIGERDCWVMLDNGEPLSAALLVAADGAHSWLRQQAKLPLTFWDYDHHALVATIRTVEPHQSCARQIFQPSGPLAFLPLADPHTSSIVWSLPPMQAKQLQQLDEAEFNHHLAAAFDMTLGLCEVQSARITLPLTMRYARDWSCDRVVLMGDAAHTIHPLAGQGVNLGLQDAALLAKSLLALKKAGKDFGLRRYLRDYERERKAETVAMIAAMEGIKRLFSSELPPVKLLRGIGLSGVNQVKPLKNLFVKLATQGAEGIH